MVKFTRRQWLTLIVMGIADFCNAICVSLQAPFYPQEAENKGCTATEYGLVFGIFELVVFIVSPIFGQHLNKIGPKITFNSGIYTTGICAILFGLLDRIEGRVPFIVLSFVIRIIEAMGNAAFLTASFAIIAKEFPNNVATTFASLETCFGFGMMIGPTVGGALYQLGGYTLPFAVMGTCLFASAILTAFVLPKHDEVRDKAVGPSMFKVLKIPGIALAALSIIATSISIGFLQATLEPHLRQFMLQPVVLGLMFVISGGIYALSAPVFGWLCDESLPPKAITAVGTVLIAAAFLLIGPAPFFPIPTILWVTILGLVLHGLGIAAQLVASFTDALRTSIANGFQNNFETFGLISGLWTSMFAFGAFIGPSLSGILYDYIGFRNSSVVVTVLHLLVGLLVSLFLCISKTRIPYVEIKEEWSAQEKGSVLSLHTSSRNASTKSIKVGNSISIEKCRPPCMNSLIACNSYNSQVWSDQDSASAILRPYSYTYGAVSPQRNGEKRNQSMVLIK